MLITTLNYFILAGLLYAAHVMPLLGMTSAFAVFWLNRAKDDDAQPTLRSRLFALLALPSLFLLCAFAAIPILSKIEFGTAITSSISDMLWFAGTFVLGIVSAIVLLRSGVQIFERAKQKMTQKTALERNKKTDVREIGKFLPAELGRFDPTKLFAPKRGIFVGLDEHKKSVFLDYDNWKISHVLLTGRTRCGKGVAAQILLSQAIARGEYVVILDPKVDNWMPHIFKKACEAAGKPYHFLDLRQSAPQQTNPFAGCDAETLENMLVGGFSLTEKGEAADFYRLADRKAARECAQWLAQNPGATARDALISLGEAWVEMAPAFHSYLSEMAELPPVNATGGLDIAAGEKVGGCLYVVGDMINPRIIRMQRMILLRLLFLAKNRDQINEGRTITVFADEFKVHISRPFITSLGASAGWGLHTILAFQSLQDLADCPADLDKDAVRGSVMENCAVQLSYAIKDPETAEWLASSTGTVLVDDETRTVEKNLALSETVDGKRSLRQAERYLVDTNMLMNLPKGCGVLATVGKLAGFCYTSPVPAERTPAAITPSAVISASQNAVKRADAVPVAQKTVAQEMLDVDEPTPAPSSNPFPSHMPSPADLAGQEQADAALLDAHSDSAQSFD